jgi:hypothetical protein
MQHDRGADFSDQLLDGGEILSCTFATMDMLRHALAAALGADEAREYGLAPAPVADTAGALPTEQAGGGDAARPDE